MSQSPQLPSHVEQLVKPFTKANIIADDPLGIVTSTIFPLIENRVDVATGLRDYGTGAVLFWAIKNGYDVRHLWVPGLYTWDERAHFSIYGADDITARCPDHGLVRVGDRCYVRAGNDVQVYAGNDCYIQVESDCYVNAERHATAMLGPNCRASFGPFSDVYVPWGDVIVGPKSHIRARGDLVFRAGAGTIICHTMEQSGRDDEPPVYHQVGIDFEPDVKYCFDARSQKWSTFNS